MTSYRKPTSDTGCWRRGKLMMLKVSSLTIQTTPTCGWNWLTRSFLHRMGKYEHVIFKICHLFISEQRIKTKNGNFCMLYFRSSELNLDHALNVLSRGLEENKESSDLWLYYLELFGRRGEQESLIELCEQAVTYAPSFALWWKVIPLVPNYYMN